MSYSELAHSLKSSPIRLGVLASHGGTNLQAIMDACRDGTLDAEVRVVISNNSRSFALERARRANIPTVHLSAVTNPGDGDLDRAITDTLKRHDVSLVILAGYMKKLEPRTLGAYRNRILNIHPALLPKYGGHGMYGERVHSAVLAASELESGATVHIVDERYDHGPIVAQDTVSVLPSDTSRNPSRPRAGTRTRAIRADHPAHSRR